MIKEVGASKSWRETSENKTLFLSIRDGLRERKKILIKEKRFFMAKQRSNQGRTNRFFGFKLKSKEYSDVVSSKKNL